ncbi:signal peptidase I [Candidatus Wolfebacteria bacterium]|nr:MAG: signal peptidase I [Candidatus Wolfebacteria bacterium]
MQSSHSQTETTPPKEVDGSALYFFKELFQFTLIALLVILPIRTFIAQPFVVSGASMDETFQDKDYLIVDQLSYRFSEPERGDVIIFRYPIDPSKFFIKRIIGLPNERIVIQGNSVTIFNDRHTDGIRLVEPYVTLPGHDTRTTTQLLSDEYFVLGDNRGGSSDSRAWGPLPKSNIIGSALLRLLPISDINYKPGKFLTFDN